MLVIRLQRTGRKGHAQFRVVVQDSRRTPTSGKIVAQVGTYDPHSKAINLNKERAEHYLAHGAQPSPRVIMLLKTEGITLPNWVKDATAKQGKLRNPEKLRRNQPKEEPVAEVPAAETETPEASVEEPAAETEPTVETSAEAPATESSSKELAPAEPEATEVTAEEAPANDTLIEPAEAEAPAVEEAASITETATEPLVEIPAKDEA